jgi:hypothetical protein
MAIIESCPIIIGKARASVLRSSTQYVFTGKSAEISRSQPVMAMS